MTLHTFLSERLFSLILVLILGISAGSAVAPTPAAAKEKKNILYINSYHNGYSWSDRIQEGIKETIRESPYKIDLQIEYMDSKKYNYAYIKLMLYDIYSYKFDQKHFDAIIVSDNNAFTFMRQFHDDLFPGVPVIFCGLNNLEKEQIQRRNLYTGLLENFDFQHNIELALRLHPQKDRVIVIGDQSVTGKAIRSQIQKAASNLSERVEFEYWSNYTLEKIISNVQDLPKDTFIYFIPIYKNISDQFYSAEELLSVINQNTNVPCYSGWEFLLGNGIIGGKLLSGYRHGEIAANMALQVLSGTSPNKISIIEEPQDKLLFDYNALKKFYIQKSQLPADSTVINEPDLFYELNQQVFWTIIISLILLSITLVLLVNNIIQRKSVEQKIKDQLSFLQLLMDTIPIPIYFKNKDGTYENCNTSFEKWFSISRSQITGKSDDDLQGKGLVQLYQEVDDSILESAGVRTYEDSILSSNGEIHDVILHKATYKNAKGEIAGFVGVLFDITDRKKAEDNLRKAEEKYRSIFENSPLGIFRITPRGKLLDCNPALARMMGYETPSALMFETDEFPRALFADERQEREVRKMLQRGSGIVQFERQFRRRDGQNLTLNINVRIIRHSLGTIKHFEGFAEDVTQKVNLERQLLQSQKMEAIGTLAGGIAHDFNNILTSIINSIELASMDVDPDSMAGNDLERALKAAQRGSHLVKQILTFSRPSQDGFISTNLAHVLQEDLSLIKASLPRNIEIRENIQARHETTTADPTQIHQIVMNLCTNAFQALREHGGVLEVSLSEVALDQKEAKALHIASGNYLCLAVSDNGPGIDTDILNKIFDPFFTTKGKGEGTGLGLAVVHGIAKNHNGAVRVSSLPWEKTSFEILLPMQEHDDELDQPQTVPSIRGAERILFVEDDEDQIATIPRVLEQLGYQVQAESDVTKALDRFRETPDQFDVVITDFDMPEVNGLELAKEIKTIAPTTPVILVSGRETAIQALGQVDNICKLVRKPYNRLSLSQAIREAMTYLQRPHQ